MAQTRVLLIDADGLAAFHADGGRLLGEGEYAPDEAGFAAFSEYLRQHRHSLFAIVADVAEEGFQLERMPYIQGSDRRAMIRRKLGQHFYGTPLATAIPQGREKSGRRDERMLFVALPRPQHFEGWLGVLRDSESQVRGLYTLPLVVASLVNKTIAALPQSLIITVTRGGLRQTFFEHGQLRFSRLTPLPGGSADAPAVAAAESVSIYQYLSGQRLLGHGAPLTTLILCHPAEVAAYRLACVDSEELRFAYLDLAAKAKEHGLQGDLAAAHRDAPFLHLVARRPPRHQLLPSPDRHSYRLWQTRVGINRVAATLLVGALLFSARQAYDFTSTRTDTAAMRAETAAERLRYDNIMRALPPTPQGAENVRAAVNRFEELERRSPALDASYVAISRALQDSASIDISRIDWLVSANSDETPTAGAAAAAATPTARPGGEVFAIADIHGLLPITMVNDHRAILDAVDGFAARLRREPNVQVRVLTMPFDIESGKSLRSDGDMAVSVSAPRFSLRMIIKLGSA